MFFCYLFWFSWRETNCGQVNDSPPAPKASQRMQHNKERIIISSNRQCPWFAKCSWAGVPMSQTSENEICLEMIPKRIFFKPIGLYIFHVIVSPLPQKCPLSELISEKLRHWKSGRSLQWAERTTGSPASQQIQQSLRVRLPFLQWLQICEQWHYLSQLGQGNKWKKES